MTVESLLQAFLGPLGLLIALLFILWAGARGYWVFGSYYASMQKAWADRYEEMKTELTARLSAQERRLDRYGTVAEGSTGLARRATDLAERRQQEGADEHVGA